MNVCKFKKKMKINDHTCDKSIHTYMKHNLHVKKKVKKKEEEKEKEKYFLLLLALVLLETDLEGTILVDMAIHFQNGFFCILLVGKVDEAKATAITVVIKLGVCTGDGTEAAEDSADIVVGG